MIVCRCAGCETVVSECVVGGEFHKCAALCSPWDRLGLDGCVVSRSFSLLIDSHIPVRSVGGAELRKLGGCSDETGPGSSVRNRWAFPFPFHVYFCFWYALYRLLRLMLCSVCQICAWQREIGEVFGWVQRIWSSTLLSTWCRSDSRLIVDLIWSTWSAKSFVYLFKNYR